MDAWQAINNIASVAGLTGYAATGAVAGYKAYASPYTSLTESERKLERVKSRLQGLSPQRREEIDLATRSKASTGNCKSLKDLEEQHQDLMDMHCILSMGYGEVTFAERHLPYSKFRKNVSDLQMNASELLNDALTTTVPYLMNKGSSPEDRRWPSIPESPNADSTPSASLDGDASAISASRAV